MSDAHDPRPPICDYEGSTYRTDFWEGKGRDYEDGVERAALRRLLPASGRRLLEIGAGFGRITDEYAMYDHVVLLDYSLSHMQDAQSRLGQSARFTYVAADAYHLPFVAGAFDGVTIIRVLHHMANAPAILAQVRRVMTGGGTFILEYANKRNLKAMLRYALRRQTWNPFDESPLEFVELNFDFHPAYIQRELQQAGFSVHEQIPVSWLRVPLLKQVLPLSAMLTADRLLGATGALVAPSIFTRNVAAGAAAAPVASASIFACPNCGGALIETGDLITCATDGTRWHIRAGIYDFKAPID